MAGKTQIRLLLRDINADMVSAWSDPRAFGGDKYKEFVQISCGDIFEGAPSADAIVSPANSFGFMDGGIDMVYSDHFGWQMQQRLQELLRREYNGELPVPHPQAPPSFSMGTRLLYLHGCAVIIPAYQPNNDLSTLNLLPEINEGQPIHFLISAPTMRIPTNVSKTVNSYLAMRAVLREVCSHNAANPEDPISTVLCPGLGTAVGRMPYLRCAVQMRTAFDAVILKDVEAINKPAHLSQCSFAHSELLKVGEESSTRFSSKPEPGELFLPS